MGLAVLAGVALARSDGGRGRARRARVGLALSGGQYDPARLRDAPPDKTMTHVLQDPAAEAEVLDTRWSPFARVDLVSTDEACAMFTDAGAGA